MNSNCAGYKIGACRVAPSARRRALPDGRNRYTVGELPRGPRKRCRLGR